MNISQTPQLFGQRTVSIRLITDAVIFESIHLCLQFEDAFTQRIVRSGVSLHLLLVLLQLGLRFCERLGLFAQLFDKRLMGFDFFPDGHLTLREPAAPFEALGGKDVGASDGLVFLFELPNMIQVLVDRIVNLIEPLLDLGGHLREAGIHRRTALNGGVREAIDAPNGFIDRSEELPVVERRLEVHRSVCSFCHELSLVCSLI